MNRNRNSNSATLINGTGINGNGHGSGSDSDDFEIIENAPLIHNNYSLSTSTSAQNAFNNNNVAGPSSGPNINKLFNPYIPKSSHFPTSVPNGHHQDDQELTKEDEEFIKRAKESLRIFQCRYKSKTENDNGTTVCNALLGNYDSLNKHVTMHLQKQFADMHEDSDDNNVFSVQAQRRYTCQWGNCKHDDANIHRLKQHIEFDHLEPELRCPFIGCNEKMFRTGYGISNLTIHTQDIRKHPPPWSETSIRPTMSSKKLPIKPLPINPNFSLPPYLISTPPILPRGKSRTPRSSPGLYIPTLASSLKPIPSIPRHIRDEQQSQTQSPSHVSSSSSSSSSRHSRSTSPTFRQMEDNILPNRDEYEIPFFPICGEAISYDSTGTFSGSIFPSTVPHEEGDDESREKDKFGRLIIPTSSERVEDGYRPLIVRKKSLSINGKSRLGRPRLGVPADVFEYKRKQKELWDKKQKKLMLRIRPELIDRKGKGKEVLDSNDGNNANGNGVDLGKRLIKFDLEKIRISALRYATRKTTKSIGIETWNEVIRFEHEGRYWDEL